MDQTSTPARTELVERASKLRPLLQSHAAWTEENRRLHEESVEAMAEAGIFRMRVPARYGGFESDARTLVDVAAELARGDGSAAWTASVWWIPTWMAGLFPDHVQDEVFSRPDVRVSGTLSPGGMAAPVDGGVVVNGKWGFISGAWHSHWQVLIAVSPTPDGGMQPVMALVPTDQLQIVDDWHTSGLRGSGSVSTIASDVFVPQERVLPLGAVLQQQYASELNAGSPMFRAPMLAVASASSVGTMTGLAAAAQDVFRGRLPGRKITYTEYEEQGSAPITHLQLGEATLLADEARFHAHRLADLVDSKGASGEAWTLEERVLCRGLLGRACRLGKESVDILAQASGGSSIYNDVPIQRVQRDAQSITLHALMNPSTNLELYGRVLCGQGPNTLYV
ncbi:acyl-CoA dehydrogenase family protein [Streptomyces globisporus]|nr:MULTISPECIES: acyl-CoA dehydrogenase family protein [Streptomyces]PPA38214.1 acyl-CoA dehydrogenase [Streptomyces griseus]RAN13412.1 acyl-CoA dehydrogenase [Streptomyces badius]AWL90763.1 acyl-CoA dehydrogenase [Streptomyces globisporus]RAN22159.1 acyl-CoA dehydrogenase [Streptomyces badius]WSF81656.1 acyl-CoA dehydrogenase family protein [Streptomyces globisporus]